MTGTVNFSIVNGFGEKDRFVRPLFADPIQEIQIFRDSTESIVTIDGTTVTSYLVTERADTSFIYPTTGYINAVDMLRHADLDFYLRAKILSIEMKKFHSFLNIELGYRLFRSKVDLSSNPNESNIRSKFIHTPELNLSMSIRPDWIIGADLNIGLHYFTTFRHGSPALPELEINDFEGNKAANRLVLRNEFNAYAYVTKKRKSGIFFRYRGYHGFKESGTFKKRQYYPSILIGYLSNLSSLIKGKLDK